MATREALPASQMRKESRFLSSPSKPPMLRTSLKYLQPKIAKENTTSNPSLKTNSTTATTPTTQSQPPAMDPMTTTMMTTAENPGKPATIPTSTADRPEITYAQVLP